METYKLVLTPRAQRDLDAIFRYVSETLQESQTALHLLSALESGILSLDSMPYRCPERRIGAYAHKGYRQLLIKNYVIIYRVNEEKKEVVVVTIRYARSHF